MEWPEQSQKPHVAIFPGPGSGHLIPLLEFAKRLTVNHGFFVTFITAKWMAATSRQIPPSSSAGMIRFIELPDVQIEGDHAEMNFVSRRTLLMEKTKILVEDALRSFSFPVCAFITDFFCTEMLDVASKLEIPSYIFFTSSASLLCIMLYLPTLLQKIEISFKDVDFPIKVPGLPPIPGIDMPSPLQDKSDILFNWFIQHSFRLHEARGFLINTCRDMEPEQVKALMEEKVLSAAEMRPSIYTVGPLISSSLLESDDNYDKEGCLKWLDRQPASSVLFVAFGSKGTLSDNQIRELAFGLEESGQRFLWVLRKEPPPPIQSTVTAEADTRELFPEGFESRTKDRGLVVHSWAPQIPVLSHPSTGGFLSHCGWNSTIESISHGVPMIAWPLVAEQRMNAFLLVKEMKVAIEAKKGPDGLVSRQEVERAARELMEGDGGMKIKKRMGELKETANNALAEGGSSYNAMAAVASVWKEMDATNTPSTT